MGRAIFHPDCTLLVTAVACDAHPRLAAIFLLVATISALVTWQLILPGPSRRNRKIAPAGGMCAEGVNLVNRFWKAAARIIELDQEPAAPAVKREAEEDWARR